MSPRPSPDAGKATLRHVDASASPPRSWPTPPGCPPGGRTSATEKALPERGRLRARRGALRDHAADGLLRAGDSDAETREGPGLGAGGDPAAGRRRLTCWEHGFPPGGKATGKCRARWGGTIFFFFRTVFSQWAVTHLLLSLTACRTESGAGFPNRGVPYETGGRVTTAHAINKRISCRSRPRSLK